MLFATAWENGMSDVIVAPSTRDLDVLSGKLSAWLTERLQAADGLELFNFAYPRGAGQSHETILFDARWTEKGEEKVRGYVVRIKPTDFTVYPDNLFDEQYQIMRLLHDRDYVRVARPLWLEQDATILGSPFFVMEKVEGRVPVSHPPYAKSGWLAEATPAQRRRLWESAVRQLAAIQCVPVAEAQFLAGEGEARDGLAQEWDKFTRFVDWVQDDPRAPILRAGWQRLLDSWPKNQPEGIVWGDSRIGNMMFDDEFEVVAVMDWEQPSLGGALHDLSWFTTIAETMHGKASTYGAYLEGMGTREETIALWQEVCGKPVDDLEWYDDFTHLKMSLTGMRLDILRGTEMLKPEYLRERLKV
jgi:aminoglycoside phosphotransferase (APT) family kinase protein